MSTYTEGQDQRYLDLVARTVSRLRETADRIEREATRPTSPRSVRSATRTSQAGEVVHYLHTMLASLPLLHLIECAHEASPREEERL